MTLELNEQERQTLIELLEREIPTLRDEIHRVGTGSLREEDTMIPAPRRRIRSPPVA